MAEIGLVPVGSHRNQKFYLARCRQPRPVDPLLIDLLCDPQTSGGLLLALAPQKLDRCLEQLSQRGVPAWHVGEVINQTTGSLVLEG
jgi:selenide,water dikinase